MKQSTRGGGSLPERFESADALAELAAAAAIDDYREQQRRLKSAFFLMQQIEPPDDVETIDRLVAGLSKAAKVHSFPGEIRKLRARFLARRSELAGAPTEIVATTKGKLAFEGGEIALFDPIHRGDVETHGDDDARERFAERGEALVVRVGGDGTIGGELRLVHGPLSLERKEFARLDDSTREVVLLCTSGKVMLTGFMDDGIEVEVGVASPRVVVSIHAVGGRILALVAPTEWGLPNEREPVPQFEL